MYIITVKTYCGVNVRDIVNDVIIEISEVDDNYVIDNSGPVYGDWSADDYGPYATAADARRSLGVMFPEGFHEPAEGDQYLYGEIYYPGCYARWSDSDVDDWLSADTTDTFDKIGPATTDLDLRDLAGCVADILRQDCRVDASDQIFSLYCDDRDAKALESVVSP